MNQTKTLLEKKTKKKTIKQSSVRKGSPMEGVGSMALPRGEVEVCGVHVEIWVALSRVPCLPDFIQRTGWPNSFAGIHSHS